MNEQKVKTWVQSLSVDQLRQALTDAVQQLTYSEDLKFGENALVPYWDADGEPIVDGQQIFEDEGE